MNFVFTPANLTVKPGAKVTWTNGDTAVHSIKDTSDERRVGGFSDLFVRPARVEPAL